MDLIEQQKLLLAAFYAVSPKFQREVQAIPSAATGWDRTTELPFALVWEAIATILKEMPWSATKPPTTQLTAGRVRAAIRRIPETRGPMDGFSRGDGERLEAILAAIDTYPHGDVDADFAKAMAAFQAFLVYRVARNGMVWDRSAATMRLVGLPG